MALVHRYFCPSLWLNEKLSESVLTDFADRLKINLEALFDFCSLVRTS